MDQVPTGLRPLLAQDSPTSLGASAVPSGPAVAGMPPCTTPSLRRKPKAPSRAQAEWDRIKPRFKLLYIVEDRQLDDVQKILETKDDFRATVTQFTTMIKKWKLKKTVSKQEYQHLIRKQEKAQNSTNPSKRKKYTIGERPIKRAKIERFKLEYPNFGPRRSPTPLSIASETERFSDISEALSQLRLGEQHILRGTSVEEAPSGSIDSEVALMVHPPQDPAQNSVNLYTNLATISLSMDDQLDDNQDDDALGIAANTSNLGAGILKSSSRTGRPAPAHGKTIPLSLLQGTARPQFSETHHPGAYRVANSKSDWWPTYALYAIDDNNMRSMRARQSNVEEMFTASESWRQLSKIFQGLIVDRSTYEDEMIHREKTQKHVILAIEANIPQSDKSCPFLYQIAKLPFDILLNRSRFSPVGKIDIRWCVSEILRANVIHFWCIAEFELLFITLELISQIVSDADKQKIFDSFLCLTLREVFSISTSELQRVDDNGTLVPDGQKSAVLGRVLVHYFDPLRPSKKRNPPEPIRGLSSLISRLPLAKRCFRLVTAFRLVQCDPRLSRVFRTNQHSLLSLTEDLFSNEVEENWMMLWALTQSTQGNVSLAFQHPAQELDPVAVNGWLQGLTMLWLRYTKVLEAAESIESLVDDLKSAVPADEVHEDYGSSYENLSDGESHGLVNSDPEAPANEQSEAPADQESQAWADRESEAWADRALEAWASQQSDA